MTYTETQITSSKTIHVILDRLAWLKVKDLTPEELRLIKRRCIFVPKKNKFNPDPIPVQLWEMENKNGIKYLGLPHGYLKSLVDNAHKDTYFDIRDNRNFCKSGSFGMVDWFKLRPGQVPAVRKVIDVLREHGRCILEARTGTGKTPMGQYVRNRLGARAVLPFHKSKLMWVWIRSIKKFEPEAKIGIIGTLEDETPDPKTGKIKKRSYFEFEDCDYVLCLYQTLISKGFEKKLKKIGWTLEQFRNYFGMRIYDEVNRGGSKEFSRVMGFFNVKYDLAATGTLRRHDGNIGIINMYCGETAYRLEELSTKEPEIIFKRTGFGFDLDRYPNSVKIHTMRYASSILPKIQSRNRIIVFTLFKAIQAERQVVIFCHTHNLINELYRIIKININNKNLPYKIGRYTGKAPRDEIIFCEQQADIVIATHKDASDGVDIPRLDTCFLVDPVFDPEQQIGRICRKFGQVEVDAEYEELKHVLEKPRKPKKDPLVVYFTDNTPQSQDAVWGFKRVVLDSKGWKNNLQTLKDHHQQKARQFNEARQFGRQVAPKTIVRKKVNK